MTIKTFHSKKKLSGYFLSFVFLAACFIPSLAFAQATTVTGKVTGSDGAGIAGVTVQEKGTPGGTATDASGTFTIKVSKPDATLSISSLGYEAQSIAVAGRSSLNVTLQGSSAKELEQVVVIGYGTANKRDLTGSIVKIAGKDVADKPNTNPIASLQSKVAGLSVVNNGTPGAAPDIRIRGTVSIGNVHPLYVVDGIFNDNIDYLNPNDIESIEILKDPSSLAIFGVKGATGVIAITTKKARVGQTIINFNTSYGYKKLVDKIKMADSSLFTKLLGEEEATNGTPFPDYSPFKSNTDWIGAVTRTATSNMNNLSVSSSTQNNRFNFGMGYTNDEGIILHEKLEKILFSFNDEAKLSKGIKLGINFNADRTNYPYTMSDPNKSRLSDALKVQPQVSALPKQFKVSNPYGLDSINENIYSGLALQGSGVVNPVLEIENTWNKVIDQEYRYVGSIYADITFLKYFNFRSTFYGDLSNRNIRRYTPLYYSYTPYDNSVSLYSNATQFEQNSNDYKKFQQDYILTFKKNFGDHHLTVTAGFTTYYFGEFLRQTLVKQGTTAADLPIPNDKRFWYVSSGPWGVVDPANTNSSQDEYSTVSGLGRLLYNYKNKYYLNASFRNDASSRLVGNNRNQQFWALGGAWEISNEGFFRSVPQINFLKLKGSVGVLGNQTASQLDGTPLNYPAYPSLSPGIVAVFGNSLFNAAQNAYIANPNLKWETVHAAEGGFELNAFSHQLYLEVNYYSKVTKDLMTFVDRSDKGLPNELINGGSLKNTGLEITSSWTQNVGKDFTVNLGGNITFMQNKVLSLAADLPSGYLSRAFANNGSAEARSVIGHPIGEFYGYIVDGLYQSYNDVLSSPVASSIGSYGPGDFKFKDITGPGSKGGPDGAVTSDDRTFIGNPSPKFTYGANVNLTYKGLNLSVDMGGVYGNDIFRVWGSLESPFQRVNYPAFKANSWNGPGTSNWDPVISQGHRFNYNGSTYNIEDGSYFRIRNLQLGYNFSTSLLSKAKISNLRIYANVQNLKTWKHNSGYTPEYGGDATAFGFDFGDGAIPMITTFGLNVTF
jgi:TonB-linked SusC/RagA family outer membrane protein